MTVSSGPPYYIITVCKYYWHFIILQILLTVASAVVPSDVKVELVDAVVKGDVDRVVNVLERGSYIDAVLNEVSVYICVV